MKLAYPCKNVLKTVERWHIVLQIIDLGRGTKSGQKQQQHVMVNMDTFSFFSNVLLFSYQSYFSKIKTDNIFSDLLDAIWVLDLKRN